MTQNKTKVHTVALSNEFAQSINSNLTVYPQLKLITDFMLRTKLHNVKHIGHHVRSEGISLILCVFISKELLSSGLLVRL